MWLELRDSFIISYIGSASKLKSLQDDFPLNVEQKNINAKVSKVIIVFSTEVKLRPIHLKVISISNLSNRIKTNRYFNQRARIKYSIH